MILPPIHMINFYINYKTNPILTAHCSIFGFSLITDTLAHYILLTQHSLYHFSDSWCTNWSPYSASLIQTERFLCDPLRLSTQFCVTQRSCYDVAPFFLTQTLSFQSIKAREDHVNSDLIHLLVLH